VLISAVVSLTLTPVLNIKLSGTSNGHSKFYLATEPFFVAIEKKYRRGLIFFLKNRWLSYSIIGICIVIILAFSKILKSELAPLEDQSFIRSYITAPEGMEYNATKNIIDSLARMNIDSVPEHRYVLARYGLGSNVNTGFIITFLEDPSLRQASQIEIYNRLTNYYRNFTPARVIASQEPTIATSTSRGLPVQFVLQNLDFEKIKEVLPKFLEEAQNSEVFSTVDADLKFNKPELNITVDRLKATSMGINERDISDALNYAFSGSRSGYFLRNNKQYFVIAQVKRNDRIEPSNIPALYVRASNGSLVQLDNLVSIKESSSPPTIYHFNRYKSATVSANLAPGRTLGEGIEEMRRIGDKLLDNSFATALSGPSRDFAESNSNIAFALVLALLLIYLILAAQFESFIDPFIIMLTVPMAISGAFLSLWITGATINIFSQIGMILLIGIVTKNGILIVEFANQKRKLGLTKRMAAYEAAAARFRPILMTSLATIFGALPIALALGSAAQSRMPLGIVVVGGLLFSLILTLFVIPVMYIALSGKKDTPAHV